MRIAYFTHSLASCWNHGNAHFQRGVLRELAARGHRVRAFEPANGWSRANLLQDAGLAPLTSFAQAFPELATIEYSSYAEVAPAVEDADLVIVHEWSDPALVAAVGRARVQGGRFLALFHDTHHRAVSDSRAMRAFDLSGYDGVLAFGESLAAVYRAWGWGARVFVWHEAADTRLFRPPQADDCEQRSGLVWIGNWGDDERSAELETFLLRPAQAQALPLDVYGVRYPVSARALLARHGARYGGWLANARVPETFARHLATIHVPRRFYVETLPGVPTIRVFEALACGIPLVTAPWDDCEGLFRPGVDFLVACSESEMRDRLRDLAQDAGLRTALADAGLETIRARHTCGHRADELLEIAARLHAPAREAA